MAIADGFDSLLSGQPERACERLEAAVDRCADLTTRAMALALLGRAHELRGDADAALTWNRRVLELSEAHGESVFAHGRYGASVSKAGAMVTATVLPMLSNRDFS